jgi:hypothetical protein
MLKIKKEEIEQDILNNTLLQNEKIQRLDEVLEGIMKNSEYN